MLYWIAAIFAKIFGLNAFSLRLVSGLSAVGIVIFTYLIVKEIFEEEKAFKCALILLTIPHFWIESRAFTPEMLLNLFSVGSVYFFLTKRIFWAWLFLALGFLTKGPVGVILPLAIVIAFKLSIKRDLKLVSLKGLLTFFIVGSSWYAFMLIHFGLSYFYKFFVKENILRFTGKAKMHLYPWYYYLEVLTVCMAFYLPAYFKALPRISKLLSLKKTELFNSKTFPFVAWFLIVLVFYSLSKGKLHHYILLCYPPLALMTSELISYKYLKGVFVISTFFLCFLILTLHFYESKRFTPLALKILKNDSHKPVIFLRNEVTALPFYLKKCIPKVFQVPKEFRGYVITRDFKSLSIKGCKLVLKAPEFGKTYGLFRCP